jgi:signal peptidase I
MHRALEMDANPYSAPRSSSDTLAEPILRKRWVAVVLALIAPPVGMLYLARPLRAVVYLAAAIGSAPAAVFLGASGSGKLAMPLVVLSFFVPVVAAVDAFRLVRSWNRAILPWYSRGPALAAFLAAGWLSILSLRAFVVEPFKIPSAAMEPTLKIGDYILVHKTSYGWNVPFTSRRLVRFAEPNRGDVAVFRYPGDRYIDYIKRVIGLPGDTVAYVDKKLSINGKEVPTRAVESGLITDPEADAYTRKRYQETLDNVEHAILIDPVLPAFHAGAVRQFPGKEGCKYQEAGVVCTVPEGHYFVMGDNRDSSSDSRYWGFVPEEDFVGRAFVIWYSNRNPERAGTDVR